MVGSQAASLTPGPSFAHNLGCICPNGSCEAILDIYTSRTFQRYKEHPNARCLTPEIKLGVCGSPGGLQVHTFGSVSFILPLIPKWGCDIQSLSEDLKSPSGLQLPKWKLPWECEGSITHTFFHSRASFLAHNLTSPCLGCEPKVRVATLIISF
jgi:hypothetical protein